MIRMKQFTCFFTLALLAVVAMNLVVTACSPGSSDGASGGRETLTMGTSADYPPYEFRDTASGDKIIGFDVDIATRITEELGYDLKIQDMDFNGLIPSLQSNRVDFVMAGMTPTEERQKNVDFSEIYYEAKNTIVAKTGSNYKSWESLAGKTVGVQLGSIQEGDVKKASEKVKNIKIEPRNRIAELIQELKANRIDAAIIEDTVAKGYIEANPDLEFATITNIEAAGSAIAFPKGSDKVDDFNRVLNEMKQNGEIEELVTKWFDK